MNMQTTPFWLTFSRSTSLPISLAGAFLCAAGLSACDKGEDSEDAASGTESGESSDSGDAGAENASQNSEGAAEEAGGDQSDAGDEPQTSGAPDEMEGDAASGGASEGDDSDAADDDSAGEGTEGGDDSGQMEGGEEGEMGDGAEDSVWKTYIPTKGSVFPNITGVDAHSEPFDLDSYEIPVVLDFSIVDCDPCNSLSNYMAGNGSRFVSDTEGLRENVNSGKIGFVTFMCDHSDITVWEAKYPNPNVPVVWCPEGIAIDPITQDRNLNITPYFPTAYFIDGDRTVLSVPNYDFEGYNPYQPLVDAAKY